MWLRKPGSDSKSGQPLRFVVGHAARKHNMSGTPEYKAYDGAKDRCTRSTHKRWQDYGGRGIEFRFTSFEQFLAELGPRPTPEHTLDRSNNDGHYEPGNVRWATQLEQQNNRRPPQKPNTLLAA